MSNQESSWNPEIPDQRVRNINTAREGVTTGEVKKTKPDGLVVKVQFGPEEFDQIPINRLEVCPEKESIRERLEKKIFGQQIHLRQFLHLQKVKGNWFKSVTEISNNSPEPLPSEQNQITPLQDAQRLLIVGYGKKKEQWQQDLKKQFNLDTTILPKAQDLLNKIKGVSKNQENSPSLDIISLEAILRKRDDLNNSSPEEIYNIVIFEDIPALKKAKSASIQLYNILENKLHSIIKIQEVSELQSQGQGKESLFEESIDVTSKVEISDVEGKEISPEYLERLVRDYFEVQYEKTKINKKSESPSCFNIDLSPEAKETFKSYLEKKGIKEKTLLYAEKPHPCYFDKKISPRQQAELIDLNHPLIQWIIHKYESQEPTIPPVTALKIGEAKIKELKIYSGYYVYVIQRWELNQNPQENFLVLEIIDSENKKPLDNEQAQKLIEIVSFEGNPRARSKIKDAKLESYDECERILHRKWLALTQNKGVSRLDTTISSRSDEKTIAAGLIVVE